MHEITHCHNERPIYDLETDVYEWDTPLAVAGETQNPEYPTYHPVIFDIETSAELGQLPILCVAYDSLGKDLIVLYAKRYQDYDLDSKTVEELAGGVDYKRVITGNISQSNFEKYILEPIHNWNEKARERGDMNRKSLVAHNTSFDIPMMGSPDDGLLDVNRIGDQYEMAVQYKDVKMVGHRAGQFGHIYQFLDSSKQYESMYIPVGDTMVSSEALWLPAKLGSACDKIGLNVDVSEADEHGNLNDTYVLYCINDVWATFLLYEKLNERLFDMFGNLPVEHIYSTASIGKYVLKKMGYKRVGYEKEAVDRIAEAYFGGRTDAEITGEIISDVCYTDILSEYPTVSKLTNVWEFMQCEYVSIERIEPEDLPDIGDLRNPEEWEKAANYYVKINPNGATLPVRTPHLEDTTKVVTSQVYSDIDIQYHYMDIVAAELIDNECNFDIVAAWKVSKNGDQELRSFDIGDTTIDANDNVMAKSIEERKNIEIHQGFKDWNTKNLKITANSLYGVSAERIVKEVNGGKHDFASQSGFYNPHVATTITAAGRLMIALGEHLADSYNGSMYYCDTDSLVLDTDIADNVIRDFQDLNPYGGKAGTLDMLEKEESGNLYATGTKKYVFFSDKGGVLEVKEHGLGNYENLRNSKTINRLWATIIYYDIGKLVLDCDILYGKLDESVLWSFNASTRSMRVMIDEMTDDYINYGDWVESTISYDDSIRYMALNLNEKSGSDEVLKVVCDEETVVEAKTVPYTEMASDNRIKEVRDIVMKFVEEGNVSQSRPEVKVTDTKVVTKESTNRKDIFRANLERQFNQNLSNISTLFDNKTGVMK